MAKSYRTGTDWKNREDTVICSCWPLMQQTTVIRRTLALLAGATRDFPFCVKNSPKTSGMNSSFDKPVRSWRVIAEELARENDEERLAGLAIEFTEALNVEGWRLETYEHVSRSP